MKKLVTVAAALTASLALVPSAFAEPCLDCGGDGGGGSGGTPNVYPTASFSSTPGSPFTLQDVSFSNGSSDSDGQIDGVSWDFGDGSGSTAWAPAHQYAHAGTYTVTLSVTDNDNATSSVSHDVTIVNRAPTASFTMKGVVQPGEDIGLANNSSDLDGQVTNYQWSFDDGSSSTEAAPQKSYANPGTYHVSLKAFDDNGSYSTMTQDVRVNAQPDATILVGATQTAGQEVQFDASAQDSDGNIAFYAWDFGDGTQASGGTPAHTYAAAGDYTVTLTVSDNDGGEKPVQTVVHVAAAPTDAGGDGDTDAGGTGSGGGANTGGGSDAGTGSQTSINGGGTGTGGSGTPGDPPLNGAQADATAPVITVPAKVKARKKTGKVAVAIASNEPVSVVARLTGKVKGSAKAKVNGKGSIVIRLSGKARKALEAAKVVKLTLKLVAADAAGNQTAKTVRVSLI
jgi:PKD repeat protein